ncbi:hypothetical protein A2704_03450 [Candidatus Kaiserbacteria bacterium RIFCSPHIGHO2_01_FULL_54_36b]|uniref:Polysaccharide pyruvyl transferase domain-containing protein n=1 Tax=Candidatus Kaiserbacteria bacterium RIFCSPHIGHO2_01_FULL_54_36b TaxID=1798483 RepID=A0A1F6CQL1_9BACT|nr:MAG: hypothetical protein A2704_03450 [Candidatus Kaiserbacteria bacterium RIFCSPHIGHO2_01_FULL_54_36b]
MPKIYIADSYALNTGDLGILFSLIASIKRRFPLAKIIVESSHPRHLRNYKEMNELLIVPRIFDIEKIDKREGELLSKIVATFIGIFDSSTFLIYALLKSAHIDFPFMVRRKRRAQALILSDVQCVLSTGGGFLSTRYNYGFRLLTYSVALLLKRKLYLCAQSIGPFETRLSRALIPFFLSKCDLITVREPWSSEYLNQFNTDAVLTADLAFLLPSHKSIKAQQQSVSICIKDDGSLYSKKNLIDLVQYLLEKNYYVYVISHTPVDDTLGQRIVNKVESKFVRLVKFGEDPSYVKQIYASNDFIISSRMHGIIFASERGIPFIALSYEPKFSGLFQLLRYDNQFIFETGTPSLNELIRIVEVLIKNRLKIQAHLIEVLPDIKESAQRNILKLEELIYASI